MKDDIDRWVNLEGPPPKGVSELLDTVVPRLDGDLEARLDKRVFDAIAREEKRLETRRRIVTWAVAAVFIVVFLAAGTGGAVKIARSFKESNQRDGLRIELPPDDRNMRAAPDGGAPRRR